MPTMNIQPVTSLINFKNGDTRVITWNIKFTNIVRSFSVTPFLINLDSGGLGMIEITKIQYLIKKDDPVRQIWITVKNTGGMMLNCDVWVSAIKQ